MTNTLTTRRAGLGWQYRALREDDGRPLTHWFDNDDDLDFALQSYVVTKYRKVRRDGPDGVEEAY